MDTWTLTGRDAAFTRLRDVSGREEGPPVGTLLIGDAGVGKSRLAGEVAAAAALGGQRVERVAATHAMRHVPMAAVAHLLPSTVPPGPNLLRTAVASLAARRGGLPTLLVVDDAHLLDDLSLALVTEAVVSGEIRAVLTVRAEAPLSEALMALWTDGHLLHEQVDPLDDESVRTLVAEHLGRVEPGLRDELVRLVGGNPLLLRELLLDAQSTGAILERDDRWVRTGSLVAGPRVRDLVRARVGRLDEPATLALELLALAEPVRLDVLIGAAGEAACLALEDRGLLRRDAVGEDVRVVATHPVHAEVVVADLGPVATRERFATLAAELAQLRRGPDDSLRVAAWALAAGVDVSADILVEAAAEALARGEPAMTERLSRTALSDAGGVVAGLLLGQALGAQGRIDEAERELCALVAGDDAERAQVLSVRAHVQAFLGRRPDTAEALLREGLVDLTDPQPRAWLRSEAALYAGMRGGFERAIEDGQAALVDLTDERMRLSTLTALSLAHAMLGQPVLADRGATEAEALAAEVGPAAEPFRDRLVANRCFAYHDLLRADEGLVLAVRALTDTTEGTSHGDTAMLACLSALAGVWTGDLEGAGLRLDRVPPGAAADAYGVAPVWPAYRALVAGHAGDLDAARRTIERVGPLEPGGPRARIWADRAAGWLLWWEGDPDAGFQVLADGVRLAVSAGHVTLALGAVEDVLRLGAADLAAELLATTAAASSPYAELLHAACGALAAADHDLLDGLASRAAGGGLRPLAADLWAMSATASASAAVDDRVVRGRAARAQVQAAVSAPIAVPTARRAPAGLTRRGLQVALLTVAEELPAAAVAARLTLSRRTVEGHLAAVYGALGIHGRDELRSVLAPAVRGPPGP